MKYGIHRLLTKTATATVAFGVVLSCSSVIYADSKIAINEKNFPDKIFRETLKREDYDKNKDGYLSSEEIKEISNYTYGFYKGSGGIKDLTGIGFLTELEWLEVFGNELTSLDLSKNTKLRILDCHNNKISNLNLSKNTKLTDLECGFNQLTGLDLSKNTDLRRLECQNNNIKTLSLSNNTLLDRLVCDGNKLASLDLSNNIHLNQLSCNDCGLTGIDVSNQTWLRGLLLKGNDIADIDLSNNSNLVYVDLNGNKIKELDFRHCYLHDLDCSDNQLEKLYVKGSHLLTLICKNNKLKTLDLSTTTKIMELQCQGNQIGTLDIGKCVNLITAFLGNETVKNGYTVYNKWDDFKLVVDNTTVVTTDNVDIDDSVQSIDIECGAVVSLNIKDADQASSVTLKSSKPSIAKIGKKNTVQALKAGSSVVTVTVDGKSYDVKVQVLYKDVKDTSKFWYAPTYALTDMGVVKGYDNQTLFKPANNCTRAQMVTFIWRLAGSPEPKTKECKFSDVKMNDYFYKACIWGNENHIVEGYKNGTFGPQIVCARRHAVTFLWRLAGKPEPNIDKIKFDDVFEDINEEDYFYKACLWASEKKIVAGYDDNTFRPDGDCLRRQMVTFLYKYDKYVNKTV